MYILKVTNEEAEIIGKGLGKLLLEEGVSIYIKLKTQIMKQQQEYALKAAEAANLQAAESPSLE